MAWGVLLGTVPVGAAGLLLHAFGVDMLRSPLVIASSTIGFGLLLWWADVNGSRVRDEHSLMWRGILFIGVAQALALIPGTSRAGVTITAGLALGLTRAGAARFSFLLSIPVIMLAGALEALEALEAWQSAGTGEWLEFVLGAAAAGVSAYLCIHYFLKLLQRIGLVPFVMYRLFLGAVLLVYFA